MGASKILFTDGEGPIVTKDLAYDLAPNKNVFELLSLYDDYLVEYGRSGYQAGDTLSLIVPFFLYHGLSDGDVYQESKKAALVAGVSEYIGGLQKSNWTIRIISTAYRPMWNIVGSALNIPPRDIACTELGLAQLKERYQSSQFDDAVREMEETLLSQIHSSREITKRVEHGESIVVVFADYQNILGVLERFYWKALPKLGYQTLEAVTVVGGKRKVDEARKFARALGVSLSQIAYVGDSITDQALFSELTSVGGLPIAVNANRYALKAAKVAVATTDMRSLRPILDAWVRDGLDGVATYIRDQPSSERAQCALIDPADSSKFEELIAIHTKYRRAVRGAAAALG